jgi:hypothetical protein
VSELETEAASDYFARYRSSWPSREAKLDNLRNGDEVTDLSGDPAVFSLTVAPIGTDITSMCVRIWEDDRTRVHLWLVCEDDVRIAPEGGELGATTTRGYLAHTNLCGLRKAHCGGELWFKSGRELYVSGWSSRFRARSDREFSDLIDGYLASGYRVCSFGWDYDKMQPARVLRDEEWTDPRTT